MADRAWTVAFIWPLELAGKIQFLVSCQVSLNDLALISHRHRGLVARISNSHYTLDLYVPRNTPHYITSTSTQRTNIRFSSACLAGPGQREGETRKTTPRCKNTDYKSTSEDCWWPKEAQIFTRRYHNWRAKDTGAGVFFIVDHNH